jgi:hypothetical protein
MSSRDEAIDDFGASSGIGSSARGSAVAQAVTAKTDAATANLCRCDVMSAY